MKLNFFKKKEKKYTIAFYNIENLFDIYDDELTRDDDFLPTAEKRWTIKRYKKKLRKIGFVISNIGKKETKKHPAIVGLAELENSEVINDLITSKHLKALKYNYVHFDSPDERGIDVALLYDASIFKIKHSQNYQIDLINDKGKPDYTRDILLVTGLLDNLEIHCIVNHWPSRRDGEKETEHKRIAAANKVNTIISQLKNKNPKAKIIVMGDFNDDPFNNSIKTLEKKHGLFNPMRTLYSNDRGTMSYNNKWNMFDQFLITHNFFERKKNTLRYMETNIFDEDFLKQYKGKYKGSPFRTYVGKRYKGGYSDHFPIYMTLKK